VGEELSEQEAVARLFGRLDGAGPVIKALKLANQGA
jgi:hypothetical protein